MTDTLTTTKLTWRRTRKGKTWAVYGPAELLVVGTEVEVHRKDGTSSMATIKGTGKTWEDKDGVTVGYGYTKASKLAKTVTEPVHVPTGPWDDPKFTASRDKDGLTTYTKATEAVR